MPIGNQILTEAQPDTPCDRVPFHTLKEGDRYQNSPGGNISQVIERKPEYATIRRSDDWLIHLAEGCFTWDKEVIKVAPLPK